MIPLSTQATRIFVVYVSASLAGYKPKFFTVDMRFYRFFLLSLFALLPFASRAQASPKGRLVFQQYGAAFVMSLPNGKPQMLPQSKHTKLASIAPMGGAIVFFVSQKDDLSDQRGWITKPPYKTAQSLKLPSGFTPWKVQWTRDGSKALLAMWDKSYLFQVSNSALKILPAGELSISPDGRFLSINHEKDLRVRNLQTGKETVIFSISRPQTVFEALKRGNNQKNLKELRDMVSPDLWKDAAQWNFGSCAFSPDNSRLFWTCNAGTGAGAAGNTSFCWFSTNLKSHRAEVLSKLGVTFGRLPYDVQLSPNGKKLLYAISVHSSAVENPVSVSVLDLLTQKETTLAQMTDNKKADMNLVNGQCWSPDSAAVAASAFYYDSATVWKEQEKLAAKDQNWEPRDADFTLYIRDLKNRTLKKISGAVAPSWGR